MLRNYFKVALRYLSKHKGYTFINILGLSVSIACCILIMQFVKSEWSFDRFHTKHDRIHRAWLEEHYQGEVFRSTVTPIPLTPVLQSAIPDIEASCRMSGSTTAIHYNNNVFNDDVALVDSNFFSMFNFPLVEGNDKEPFPNSSSVVVTERMAKKFFGNNSAIGQNVEIELQRGKTVFTVSGIAKDPPLESSIVFDFLIPFSNEAKVWSEQARTQGWSNVVVESFILLKPGADIQQVHKKVASVLDPLVAKNYKPGQYLVRLQPLDDVHFNSTLPETVAKPSDPKYSYILATIGILILLIACINFVTLSVGRSVTRALEVGVRKVLGAERKQIIWQFWGEAILVTFISVIVGIGLSYIFQDSFNELANRELSLSLNLFTVSFFVVLIGLIALLAGMYPSLVLSGFKPIEVLKGKLKVDSMGFFRKALVVGQFVASIIMIIATITVTKQLNYLQNKNLGYNREHVIVVPTNMRIAEGRTFAKKFQEEVHKTAAVINTTASLYAMHNYGWMSLGFNDDKNVFRQFKFNIIDEDFIPAMQLQMASGRNFEKNNPADSGYIIVNEALVREYGWKNPIGQKLPGKYQQTVIGVVKDFNIETLYTPVKPAVMAIRATDMFENSSDVSYDASPSPRISVRFREGNLQEHVALLKSAWKQVAGDKEFDSVFLDESLAAAYQQEQRLGKIVTYASILSIFIACMGLFGLATLVVVRRTKEIGIRKVLGADVPGIVSLLSKDFVVLVAVASLVAFPLAWWSLQKWLQDFAYRIDIPWLSFIGAAVMALLVALLTVSIQAMKAALMNPVKSLRTE